MTNLLAKSPRDGKVMTLLQHTLDVMNAVECLFGLPDNSTRLGREWLRFFKIPSEQFSVFQVNLLAAAACHDWGKANDGFQRAVRRQGDQVIRHEHLSALMLGLESVTVWLKNQPAIDTDLVLSAVMTHHLKAIKYLDKKHAFATRLGPSNSLRLHCDAPEFLQILQAVSNRLGIALEPKFPSQSVWSFPDGKGIVPSGMFDLVNLRDKVMNVRLHPVEVSLRKDDEANRVRRRLLWAVRAGLIASDAVGSGIPREGKDMRPWIKSVFDEGRVCDETFIDREIIQKRKAELEQKGKWAGWSEFQIESAYLPPRALLLAPCGSGKTLAAWRWIAARLKDRPAARVIFLYPTRATAKEGFRDYVSWAPGADAALMHGTSAFDLQDMFSNENDPRHENDYEVDRRLFALGFWTRRVFSATVDQFLAFLQYGYGPMCMLPALADSVVVIDEVHSFDRNMFSALKDFLKAFDVPVLCMTATLPNIRRSELINECDLKPYENKPGELKTIAEASRYKLRRVDKAELPIRIRSALNEGKRVLWVVNQVKRAQQGAINLATDFRADPTQEMLHVMSDVPLFCYHSRFKLSDRVGQHNNVVDRFRADRPAALAITTQVCEMSLDMDADLLVTEECPITSLIQRMGRCNRARLPRGFDRSGEVVVYRPDDPKPYDAATLTGVEQFLTELSSKDSLNQVDLEEALRNAPPLPAVGDAVCSFLKSGPYALGGEEDFREIEEFSRPSLLKSDVDAFLSAGKADQPGFVVPVPRKLSKERDDNLHSKLPRYLGVAPDGHYHHALGFCDNLLAQMGGAT